MADWTLFLVKIKGRAVLRKFFRGGGLRRRLEAMNLNFMVKIYHEKCKSYDKLFSALIRNANIYAAYLCKHIPVNLLGGSGGLCYMECIFRVL